MSRVISLFINQNKSNMYKSIFLGSEPRRIFSGLNKLSLPRVISLFINQNKSNMYKSIFWGSEPRRIFLGIVVILTCFLAGACSNNVDHKKEDMTGVNPYASKVMKEVYGPKWKEKKSAVDEYKNNKKLHLMGAVSLPADECEDIIVGAYGKDWRKNRVARAEYYACRIIIPSD